MKVVNGFTGSSIWHLLYSFPPVPDSMIADGFKLLAERWNPILDVFRECGVRFGLEVHPTEIAFDLYSAETALKATRLPARVRVQLRPEPPALADGRPGRVPPGASPTGSITSTSRTRRGRSTARSGILGSHLNFGDPRRGWDFRSPGRGQVDFEEIARALNQIGYDGPLSVEWEDPGMDREHGAAEAAAVRQGKDGLRRRRPALRLGLRRGPGRQGVSMSHSRSKGTRCPLRRRESIVCRSFRPTRGFSCTRRDSDSHVKLAKLPLGEEFRRNQTIHSRKPRWWMTRDADRLAIRI